MSLLPHTAREIVVEKLFIEGGDVKNDFFEARKGVMENLAWKVFSY